MSYAQQTEALSPTRATQPRWSRRIREIHRWTSIVFTALVVTNLLANFLEEPPMWLGFLALPPLVLLLLTGLYLFVLPYAARRRKKSSAG